MSNRATYRTFRFKDSELGVFNMRTVKPILSRFKKGVRIIGLSRGLFSLIDLIHGLLEKTGPANVVCVTWSAGIKDVHQIEWMKSTHLIKSFCLITDHSYKSRQKKYALSIEQLFGEKNIRTSEIHAKFTLIWNKDYKVCIRTSMNLNANKTCETFEIDESAKIFNFYKDFVDHTFKDMPKGFTLPAEKVNKSLDKFFISRAKVMSGWAEI